jgi:HAD superfamily hydrolase (TIGR01549 family)
MTAPRPILRGVVFDMDGTLTVPNLDFAEMYRRCGVDLSQDILAEIARMPPDQAERACSIIEEIEEEGRRTLQLMPGALAVTSWLVAHNIPTALVTRNTRRTVDRFATLLQGKASFDIIITREDERYPPKPHPAALLDIAKRWQAPPSSLVMVGDSIANDIVFGSAAGSKTVLLDTRFDYSDPVPREGPLASDILVQSLGDLPHQLWNNFDIDSPLGTRAQGLHGVPAPKATSLLGMAAVEGDVDKVDVILTAQLTDVDERDDCGNTPLIWAAENGHLSIVERFISAGADFNVQGYLGATALCRAARRGHVDVLRALIKQGANMNVPNHKFQYPLHFAAFKEHEDAVHVLLEAGADAQVLDRKGRIPAQDTKNERIREAILAAMQKMSRVNG